MPLMHQSIRDVDEHAAAEAAAAAVVAQLQLPLQPAEPAEPAAPAAPAVAPALSTFASAPKTEKKDEEEKLQHIQDLPKEACKQEDEVVEPSVVKGKCGKKLHKPVAEAEALAVYAEEQMIATRSVRKWTKRDWSGLPKRSTRANKRSGAETAVDLYDALTGICRGSRELKSLVKYGGSGKRARKFDDLWTCWNHEDTDNTTTHGSVSASVSASLSMQVSTRDLFGAYDADKDDTSSTDDDDDDGRFQTAIAHRKYDALNSENYDADNSDSNDDLDTDDDDGDDGADMGTKSSEESSLSATSLTVGLRSNCIGNKSKSDEDTETAKRKHGQGNWPFTNNSKRSPKSRQESVDQSQRTNRACANRKRGTQATLKKVNTGPGKGTPDMENQLHASGWNTDALFSCPICLEHFEYDLSKYDSDMKRRESNLPIFSAACSHKVCCSCLSGMQLAAMGRRKKAAPKWFKCPTCKAKTAFNAVDLKIDLIFCECIRRLQLSFKEGTTDD